MISNPITIKQAQKLSPFYMRKNIQDFNVNIVNYQSDKDGWTTLDDAVLKGNIQIVKILLEYGADPRVPNFKNETPIDMATKFGKGEIVKLLRDQDKKLHWNQYFYFDSHWLF